MKYQDGKIILYGAQRCSKTVYYQQLLQSMGLPFDFRDVEVSETAAEELINLYETRRLNFPTLMLGTKKLRNPSDEELRKWLEKLGYLNEGNRLYGG